jgi:ribosome maturation factor RimP
MKKRLPLRSFLKKIWRGRTSPLFVYTVFSMDLSEEIKKLAESRLTTGQFIVDIVASSRVGPKKVAVIVDADQGISIDDCAELSRELSKLLDDSGLIDDNYLLEVSTPGIEHPLKLKRQYRKNIGRGMKIKLHDKTIEGKLTEVMDDRITLTREVGSGKKKEAESLVIPFSEIDKAFVLVSFK